MVGTSIKSLIDLFKPECVRILYYNEVDEVEDKKYNVNDIPPTLMIKNVFPIDYEPAVFITYFGETTLWIKIKGSDS